MSTSAGPLAVIIGAGVAGLSCAWWLTNAGWRVIVAERAPHLRDGGYMMGLSGPGLYTARRMGLVPALRAVEREIGENVYRDRRGRELMRIRYRELLKEIEWIILKRTDLVQVLHEAVAGRCELRLGVSLVACRNEAQGVEVALSNGEALRADLLIGADGVHSELRERVFGADAESRRMEQLGYRYAAYDADDTLGLTQNFVSYAAVGHQVEYHGLGGGRLAALHVWRSTEHGSVPGSMRRELLAGIAGRTHPDAARILAGVSTDTPIALDDLAMIRMPNWHRGRVALVGDAAHSLSLISGQGAGMAMASASVLAQELQRRPMDIEHALRAHEARLRPIIMQLQQRSRKLAPVYVPASAWGFALRNSAMRALPRFLLKRYFLSGLKSELEAAAALA
ncbi:FAD-dependent oxidoreductase [Candidimonas nitroreducens]|uniref:2-polyprenyl-6-methoxyphenol hydroxylase n=1 Tax=Candidimonas nitroreducens TaxID=683354 RepID=A0A225MYT6_9BURK|nr:FAD-dependent oxidoreductase [Candidimonas nitroreducens]OWT66385.1 2-polyprenyl-6-methoxyphenol hydroxylase [Candidimonas nitroreducens]